MLTRDLLGHFATLEIRRIAAPGAYLGLPEGDPRDVVLLIGSEIPPGAEAGALVEAFVYLDSEGRLLATTRIPKLSLGEVAFLEVTECTPIGAFVDWGLQKDLLVPFAEQTTELRKGERYAIGVYVDDTGRLAGTMRIAELLTSGDEDSEDETDGGGLVDWQLDEWVPGEAWRNDANIGLFVIIEKRFVGVVPRSEPHSLARGEAARFRVANILEDGKVELSLRGHAHEELASDAKRILEALSRKGAPALGDRSSPEEIRAAFGLSKKAFKRAAGRLLKEGAVTIDARGLLGLASPHGAPHAPAAPPAVRPPSARPPSGRPPSGRPPVRPPHAR